MVGSALRNCSKGSGYEFSKWGHDHEKYKPAQKILKTRQRQAYAKYRKDLHSKLAKDNNNNEWWNVVKLHMDKNGSRKCGAP